MDLINELTYFLSQKNQKEIDHFIPKHSKTRMLYDLILKGIVKNDNEAANKIYNTNKSDKKYLMLKRNLIQKLSDLVFLTDQIDPEHFDYADIKLLVEKELNVAEKLLNENVYHNPSKIISKAEQTAEKYYLIDLQLETAKKIRSIYSLKGFPSETIEYNEKIKDLSIKQSYYNEAQGDYEVLYSKAKYSISKPAELIKHTELAISKIEQNLKAYNSPFLKLYKTRLCILKYDFENSFDNYLKAINDLNSLLDTYDFLQSKSLKLELFYNYAKYYRYKRDINQSIYYLEECFNLSEYGAFNRFLVQELNFDLQIKSKDYNSAFEIIKEVNKVPQFEFLDPNDKSAWIIREAYLHFALRVNKQDDLIKNLPNLKLKFNINHFFELTKKSSGDKNGYNVILLIIRVLFLAKKNIKNIDTEGNNLQIYYYRYLKEFNSPRTKTFFKAIAKAAIQNFNKEYMEVNKNIFQSLDERHKNEYDSFEIIPYEELWEMIVEWVSC